MRKKEDGEATLLREDEQKMVTANEGDTKENIKRKLWSKNPKILNKILIK